MVRRQVLENSLGLSAGQANNPGSPVPEQIRIVEQGNVLVHRFTHPLIGDDIAKHLYDETIEEKSVPIGGIDRTLRQRAANFGKAVLRQVIKHQVEGRGSTSRHCGKLIRQKGGTGEWRSRRAYCPLMEEIHPTNAQTHHGPRHKARGRSREAGGRER